MLVIYRSVQGIGYHTRMRRAWTPTGEWVWRTWCKSHTNILQCVTRVRRYLCAQTETSQLGIMLRDGKKQTTVTVPEPVVDLLTSSRGCP